MKVWSTYTSLQVEYCLMFCTAMCNDAFEFGLACLLVIFLYGVSGS